MTSDDLGRLYKAYLDSKAATAIAQASQDKARTALEAALMEGEIYSPSQLPIVRKVNGKLVESTPLPLLVPAA